MNQDVENFTTEAIPTEAEALHQETVALVRQQFRSSALFRSLTKLCNISYLHGGTTRALLVVFAIGAFSSFIVALNMPEFILLAALLGAVFFTLFGFTLAVLCIVENVELLHERLSKTAATNGILLNKESQRILPSHRLGLDPLDTVLELCENLLSHPQKECGVIVEEHQELLERYELLTTNLAAAVMIYERNGMLSYCSPYTRVLTGYTSEEISQHNLDGTDLFNSIVVDEDRGRYLRARAVSELGEEMLVRFRIHHKSGLTLWLETQLVPVCDENGEVTSIMSLTIDVTDSLSYQEQIEEQNRDLSDFAYMVSHDLKAPIFTIKGMAHAMLEDHAAALGEGREMLQYIIDGANRLEELVTSVIQYSSVATKELKEAEVDLNAVLTHVQADLGELMKERKAKITFSPERLPQVRGDEVRIYQVLSNLLGNSLKYAAPGRTPEIHIAVDQISSDFCAISVRDNGLGIPSAKVSDVFRPYHRAHSGEIREVGLDLPALKKLSTVLVAMFPSKVLKEKEARLLSLCHLRREALEKFQENWPDFFDELKKRKDAVSEGVSILLVDDNVAHRKLIVRALRKSRLTYSLFEAGSIAEARGHLDNAPKLSIAVIDLNLTDGRGSTLASELRLKESYRELPILILSTSDLEEDIKECMASGASRFLTKADDLLLFVSTVVEDMRLLIETSDEQR